LAAVGVSGFGGWVYYWIDFFSGVFAQGGGHPPLSRCLGPCFRSDSGISRGLHRRAKTSSNFFGTIAEQSAGRHDRIPAQRDLHGGICYGQGLARAGEEE